MDREGRIPVEVLKWEGCFPYYVFTANKDAK